MPRNESNKQPPPAIDRAGMYSIDIQEFRQNFRALADRLQRIEAAHSAHTKTLALVLDAYNGSTALFRAMTERLEQLTARVEQQREQSTADAKATRSALTQLGTDLPATIKSFLEATANTIVVAQQDLATIVQRELRAGTSSQGRGGATRPTPPDGSSAAPRADAAPRVDAVPSIDSVLASLPTPRPQATTRHGRRNWLVGRVHVIEVRLFTSGHKPVASLATELKQAIDDIRCLRSKGRVAVAAIPSSLHALTQTDPSWQADAKQHDVFVLEPQHLVNFAALVNNRGKGSENTADGLRLQPRLMEIGEALRAIPGTERLRTSLAQLITDITPPPADSRLAAPPTEEAPQDSPRPLTDNTHRKTPPEPSRKETSAHTKGTATASQPPSSTTPHGTALPTPTNIFDSVRTEHQHDTVDPPTDVRVSGTHTQKWTTPNSATRPNTRTPSAR